MAAAKSCFRNREALKEFLGRRWVIYINATHLKKIWKRSTLSQMGLEPGVG